MSETILQLKSEILKLVNTMPDYVGESSVFLTDRYAIKGFSDLTPKQLRAYQKLTGEVAKIIDGEHTLENGQLIYCHVYPILEILDGDGNKFKTLTISERAHPGDTALVGGMYGDALASLNQKLRQVVKYSNVELIPYNTTREDGSVLGITDVVPSIRGLMSELRLK